MFDIKFNDKCRKRLLKLPKEISSRIIKKIKELPHNPIPHDAKRIVNVRGKIFRVRVGDYRILYVVSYEENLIIIVNIDNRERVYDF
jgi:mRNA interferase RelE/StbE